MRCARWPEDARFNYYDDRPDNVSNVRERFGSQVNARVVRADTLHKDIRAVRKRGKSTH